MTSEQYLISELAHKAGVSVRTIRYYISEGLLPSPQVRGRYSVYEEEYIERIQLIKRLKEAFLPIKEIRKKLETQTLEAIEEFLANYASTSGPSNDALDYISSVLNEEQPMPMMHAKMSAPAPAAPSASWKSSTSRRMLSESRNEPDGTMWKRFEVARGVELLISEDVYLQSGQDMLEWIEDIQQGYQRRIKGI
jgi:DNA-binding transcriptional MerR regulator